MALVRALCSAKVPNAVEMLPALLSSGLRCSQSSVGRAALSRQHGMPPPLPPPPHPTPSISLAWRAASPRVPGKGRTGAEGAP